MAADLPGWIRVGISTISFLRTLFKREPKPDRPYPVDAAFVETGIAYLEIENRGVAAAFDVPPLMSSVSV
jgi:hypothetical protein